MKTSRNHCMDRVRARALIRDWNSRIPIGTKVAMADGTETATFGHAGMDIYGAAVVFVESVQHPIELGMLTLEDKEWPLLDRQIG